MKTESDLQALLFKKLMELSATLNGFMLQNVDVDVYRDALIMFTMKDDELKEFVTSRAKLNLSLP